MESSPKRDVSDLTSLLRRYEGELAKLKQEVVELTIQNKEYVKTIKVGRGSVWSTRPVSIIEMLLLRTACYFLDMTLVSLWYDATSSYLEHKFRGIGVQLGIWRYFGVGVYKAISKERACWCFI